MTATSPCPYDELAFLRQARGKLQELLPSLESYKLPPIPVIDLNAPNGAASAISSAEVPGLKKLVSAFQKEIDFISKVLDQPRTGKTLPASNAPHLLALAECLRLAPFPIIAINQTFPLSKSLCPQLGSGRGRAKAGGEDREVKVHVLSDGGKLWARVVATTNQRLLREFLETDSYINSDSSFSDSSSSSGSSIRSSNPFPNHLTTSLHKIARSLLQAASLFPSPPTVQLQLPRLRPGEDRDEQDGRVSRTVRELKEMGVHVIVGIEGGNHDGRKPLISRVKPTLRINLDLSCLIALSSAIVHDPLPEDGNPKGVFRELVRKFNRDGTLRKDPKADYRGDNWRALELQLEAEMKAPLVDELACVLSSCYSSEELVPPTSPEPATSSDPAEPSERGGLEFWTTPEARERLVLIVAKLGGPLEVARSQAMFWVEGMSKEENEARARTLWDMSRYKQDVGVVHLALASIRTLPSLSAPSSPSSPNSHTPKPIAIASLPRSLVETHATLAASLQTLSVSLPPFGSSFPIILASCEPPFSHLLPPILAFLPSGDGPAKQKAPASLTPHTIDSLLAGAMYGMTTISANRASLKSLWKGLDGSDPSLGIYTKEAVEKDEEGQGERWAVAWVLEPRSLGESMRCE